MSVPRVRRGMRPAASMPPTAPEPSARPGADDVPRVLDLLDRPGCVLCRTQADAAGTWMRWFVLENHSDPATLLALGESTGFCPAHTRRVLTEAGPDVLRLPWEFTVRGAIDWAGRLASGRPAGRFRRSTPRASCPLCRVIAQRERATRSDLAACLDNPEVMATLRDRGALCYRHLRDLLPGLPPAQAAVAAAAVADLLTGVPPGSREASLMLAGHDLDALARAPYLDAHALALTEEAQGNLRAGRMADLAPADRMIAELIAGSCPVCRATGREETRYLRWLGEHRPRDGPASLDLHLCGVHLHDAWSADGAEGAGPLVTGVRGAAARDQAAALAAAAGSLRSAPRGGRPPARVSGGKAGRRAPQEAFRVAAHRVIDDGYCRACRVGEGAAARQQALLRACLRDPRVLRVLEESHGLCLRHGAEVAAGPETAPVLIRLLSQLRQVQWELDEDAQKQAWDRRHEPKGREQAAWRRLPALLDGEAHLGTTVSDGIGHAAPSGPPAW